MLELVHHGDIEALAKKERAESAKHTILHQSVESQRVTVMTEEREHGDWNRN